MCFDESYTCVLCGGVMSTVAGTEESHEQSRFGVSLFYINAATEDRFVELLSRDPQTIDAPPITAGRCYVLPCFHSPIPISRVSLFHTTTELPTRLVLSAVPCLSCVRFRFGPPSIALNIIQKQMMKVVVVMVVVLVVLVRFGPLNKGKGSMWLYCQAWAWTSWSSAQRSICRRPAPQAERR